MKCFVFLIAATASFNVFAGDYITGQAARMIIGQATFTDQYPGTSDRLLGAAGGVAFAKDILIIADSSRFTGLTPQNRRVVTYKNVSTKLPQATDAINVYRSRCPVCTARVDFPYSFDNVLGQPDFNKNDQAVSQQGLRLPTAVATDGNILAVADTENNRILIWNSVPDNIDAPADIVLGQDNFNSVRQPIIVDNKSFRGPQGVWIQDNRFFVADTQNHRVMIWNRIPTQNNAPADIVLGQKDFNTAPEPDLTKITTSAHANTMLNPVSVTSDGKHLFVSDLGFSRVLIWNSIPTQTQQPADVEVGQVDMDSEGANNTSVLCASNGTDSTTGDLTYPVLCEKTLSFPRFALSDGQRLYISDSGNDRVLIYDSIPTANATAADKVLGQPDMVSDINTSASDLFHPNLQQSASDIIPAPAALAWDPAGQNLYVADPTDRRVLVFSPLSPDVPKDGVRNAASLQIFAVSVVSFTASPKENDEITITINSVDYKYKATSTDKISDMITGLVNVINAGTGDPNILAIADLAANAFTLTARVPGDAGFAVTITDTLSTGAQVAITLTKSNPTTQTAQQLAPGTLVTIFGDDLADTTVAAPADAQQLPYELGGVQVYFDGNRAPILAVSPTQINTQIPYEVLDATSISSWLRITHADGSLKKVTTAVPIPVTPQNPGIFAEAGDEPRRALAYHYSNSAVVTVSVDGTITANDTATITIEDRSYTYTVQTNDTLANVRDGLIALINANGDEKVTATPAGTFTRVILTSKIPGDIGNGIPVTTAVSTGAAVILTASKAATCCAAAAGSPINADNPAMAGETIVIYGTGLGLVTPEEGKQGLNTGDVYTGPALNDPVSFVSSLAGGKTANVISAGAMVGTPKFPAIGLYQVVLELNSDLPTDPQTQLTIAQDIYTSNIVTIPVISTTPTVTP